MTVSLDERRKTGFENEVESGRRRRGRRRSGDEHKGNGR